jgi:metal-responsive CopG/Arc/MetJ family transcriptional regulator
MAKSAKIAISLPADLLNDIERERETDDKSRSEFIVQAVQEFLKNRRKQQQIERYIRGYELYPETEEEAELSSRIAAESMAQSPW